MKWGRLTMDVKPQKLHRMSDNALETHLVDVMREISERPGMRATAIELLGDQLVELKLEQAARSSQPELFSALAGSITRGALTLAHSSSAPAGVG
jgi:hypothetical protein